MARNYSRVGAFINAQRGDAANALGGTVVKLASAANALSIGQAVKFDSAGQLVVCGAQTDGPLCIGIVVGGKLTDGVAMWSSANVGTAVCAATAGQEVLVAMNGSIVWAKKTTGATMSAGSTAACGASGGLVTGATLLFSQVIGTPLVDAASGDAVVKIILSKR